LTCFQLAHRTDGRLSISQATADTLTPLTKGQREDR
jgi:hypothetical protein